MISDIRTIGKLNLVSKILLFSGLVYFIIFLSASLRLLLFFQNMGLLGRVYYIGLLFPLLFIFCFYLVRKKLSYNFLVVFQNINLSLFVCLFSTAIFQLYIYIPMDFHGSASALVRPFDERSTGEVVLKMRRQGIMAYPAPLPASTINSHLTIPIEGPEQSELSILGLSGVSNSTTIYCSEAGPYLIYESDRYGFANPKNIWSRSMDFVFLGDSFTHGACVAVEDHFTAIVRAQFPGTFNLGMRGNGPLLELATLKEFVRETNPKYIFWMYFDGNDLIELERESQDNIAIKYLQPNFNVNYKKNFSRINKKLADLFNTLLQSYENTGNRSADVVTQQSKSLSSKSKVDILLTLSDYFTFGFVMSFGRDALCASFTDINKLSRPCKNHPKLKNLLVFKNVLASAKKFADERGSEFVFVNLPSLKSFNISERKRMSMVRQILANLNIDEIDIAKAADKFGLSAENGDIFAFGKLGGHLNVRGNRLVGCAILEFIAKHSNYSGRSCAGVDCLNSSQSGQSPSCM